MFELNDATIEQIVFAMEDQENATVVDLATGKVVPAEGLDGEGYASPPTWSSREGFRLMEDFLATVRLPSARRELTAALSRGRGVFKAFKASLAAYPEVERAFRDFKVRAMRRSIADWYDELRTIQGLARLGPEPEETEELIASDLEIRVVGLAEAKELIMRILDQAAFEALESLPAVIADFEAGRLRTEIGRATEGICALADDGEGGALGAALAFRHISGERSLGRVVFLNVREGFRRIGLGKALLAALSKAFTAEGITLILLDSIFLPPELEEGLATLGYKPLGLRETLRLDG